MEAPAPRKFVLATLAPLYTPPGGPPQAGPSRDIYARMGEDNIFKMCADFYVRLEQSPIRIMFTDDMPEASKRLAAFLVGLLGGPPLYQQRHGDPRMRSRHLAFAIDGEARGVWLDCFRRTLEGADKKYGFPPEHLAGFVSFLDQFSAWMVNRK